jgi:hypothetical protein
MTLTNQATKYAVFSTPTNELLWLGDAATMEDAVIHLNREFPISDTEPSDDEDFIYAVQVSAKEAKKIAALEWGSPLPVLEHSAREISYTEALEIVSIHS